jgi:hypothetical protein
LEPAAKSEFHAAASTQLSEFGGSFLHWSTQRDEEIPVSSD